MKHYIMNYNDLSEAAYSGNIGFEEMCKFYDVATPAEEEKMKKILHDEDWEAFKKLINEVLKIKLK